jgi:hypothetical protein
MLWRPVVKNDSAIIKYLCFQVPVTGASEWVHPRYSNLKHWGDFSSYLECFGSVFIWYGSGSRILCWIPIRIQGFDDQKKKLQLKKLILFWSKATVYPSASRKDVKATEAFTPQKRKSRSTSKHEIS